MSPSQLPSGFQFAGVTANVKPTGKPDLALIVAETECVAAGVYTQNIVRAASIDWNRSITPSSKLRGVVINSGNANACTGAQGETDNLTLAQSTAGCLGVEQDQIAVLSTGVIGQRLPIAQLVSGIGSAHRTLGNSLSHFDSAAEAILTTDKSSKTIHSRLSLGDHELCLSGMAKGAGMIGPNMATMLAVITTDAALDPPTAQSLIQRVADRSFNNISVEGHTSTNDALLLLASGRTSAPALDGPDLQQFENELTRTCIELAKQIPSDGEGASHLIEIQVTGATTDAEADQVARSIAQSNLVKCAIAGGDPNWGRIVSAVGYCGVPIEPKNIGLHLNGHEIYRHGTPTSFDSSQISDSIKHSFETRIEVLIGSGQGQSTHWTSDLTTDYVQFNSEYTT